jgi:anti-sigma factor ChrR (cupin superfamily)
MTSTSSAARELTEHTVMGMTAEQIELLPWLPVTGCPGVHVKELWRMGELVYALLRYQPGSTTPGHPHPGAHQHIWVLRGEASIDGNRLTTGSYAHVPPDSPHPIRGLGPWGCVLLQTHVPGTAARTR